MFFFLLLKEKKLENIDKLMAFGGLVFVDDAFFDLVKDPNLKINKGLGHARPHYFAVRDKFNENIYWVVPISSKVDKFDKTFNKKLQKGQPTDGLRKIKVRGQDRYLLFQDMFPVSINFLTVYSQSGTQVYLKEDRIDISSLEKQARKVIGLFNRNVHFVRPFVDTKRIIRILHDAGY